MIKYLIEPRVKKRWFKENELFYDLVKYSEKEEWFDYSFGNGEGEYITVKRTDVIFTDKDTTVVINLKNKLDERNI